MTTCAQAIKNFETINSVVATEVEHVKLYCQQPPIAKMDAALNTLVNCERLALSTNTIDRIIPLGALTKLKILSVGRNAIKKVSGAECCTRRKPLKLEKRQLLKKRKHSYYSSLPRFSRPRPVRSPRLWSAKS